MRIANSGGIANACVGRFRPRGIVNNRCLPRPERLVTRRAPGQADAARSIWNRGGRVAVGGRVPLGMITMFAGDPKLGKSYVTLAMAAALSRGLPLPAERSTRPARQHDSHECRGRPGADDRAPAGGGRCRPDEDPHPRVGHPRQRLGDPSQPAGRYRRHHGRRHTVGRLPADRDRPGFGVSRRASTTTATPRSAACSHRSTGWPNDWVPPSCWSAISPKRVLPTASIACLGSIAYVGACRANHLFVADPDDPTGRRVLMLDNGGNVARLPRLGLRDREPRQRSADRVVRRTRDDQHRRPRANPHNPCNSTKRKP